MHILDLMRRTVRKLVRVLSRRKISLKYPVDLFPISKAFGLDRGLPLDRVFIQRFLSDNSNLIVDDCLEVGGDEYLTRYGSSNCSKHILQFSPDGQAKFQNNLFHCDITKPSSLPEEQFDTLVFTQTLNFVYEIDLAIQGMHKLLRPGGHALITVAGISQISRFDHDRWGDYWRFTDMSLKTLLVKHFGADNVQVTAYGNVAVCCMFLQGLAEEDVVDKSLFDHVDPDYQMTICAVARK